MKLIVEGSLEQIIEAIRKLDVGLAVLDLRDDSINIRLDANGNSCVVEKMEIDPPKKKPTPVVKAPEEPKHHKEEETQPTAVVEDTPASSTEVAADINPDITALNNAKATQPKRKSGAAPKGATRKCELCGEEFSPKWYRSKYCQACIDMYGSRIGVVAAKLKKQTCDHTHDAPGAQEDTPSDSESEGGRRSA